MPAAERPEPAKDRDLELLEIIERSAEVTQRGIAGEMRIALGLANSCLKRMARKGWIKINEAPGRRLLYYLTPKGMAEKTRLTYAYISYSVHFYADARARCRRLFAEIVEGGAGALPDRRRIDDKRRSAGARGAGARAGRVRVAFLGASELAEIAYLTLQEFPLEFAGIFDDGPRGAPSSAPAAAAAAGAGRIFFGRPIMPLAAIPQRRGDYDVLVYTRIEPPDKDPALAELEFFEILTRRQLLDKRRSATE